MSVTIDAGAASNFTTSVGALTLDGAGGVNIQGNASEIDITTSGAVDINSGAFTLDGSTVSVDGTDDMNFTMTANAAIPGDWVSIESDGTNWYVTGQAAAATGIAFS